MKQSQIIKLFTKGEVNYEDIENQILEVSFGFKLVQVAKTRFDTRLSQTSKEWMVNKELGWGGSLSNDFPNDGILLLTLLWFVIDTTLWNTYSLSWFKLAWRIK